MTTSLIAQPASLDGKDLGALTTKTDKVQLRNFVKHRAEDLAENFIDLGRLFWGVRHGKYFEEWGYNTFYEYVEQEVGLKPRMAEYMIAVFKTFRVEIGVSDDEIKGLTFTQLRELASVANSGNYRRLITASKGKTVKETKELVRAEKGVKKAAEAEASGEADSGEDEAEIFFQAKLFGDQIENVQKALEVAQSMTGSEKKGNLLDLICLEFLSNTDTDLKLSLKRHISRIERTFDTVLVPFMSREDAKLALKLLKKEKGS